VSESDDSFATFMTSDDQIRQSRKDRSESLVFEDFSHIWMNGNNFSVFI
jgi:hypothetical protein